MKQTAIYYPSMHTDDNKILDYCLLKWNTNFCGISSLEASKDLDLPHDKVRNAFKRLKGNRKGTIIDEVKLGTDYGTSEIESREKVTATIFYPSHTQLKKYFLANRAGFSNIPIPPFQKDLHLGHRTFELYFFSPSVLNRYFDNAEKYNIQDYKAIGFFASNKDYISGLKLQQAHEKSFSVKRYGKVQTEAGDLLVTAMLADLAEMPVDEQNHWLTHKFEGSPAVVDLEFQKQYLKFFKSVPADSHDPLHDLLNLLQKINSLQFLGKIFKNLDPTNLKYPVQNTYQSFKDSCKELYKHISPDELDNEVIQKFLSTNLHYQSSDFSFRNPLKLFQKFLNEFELSGNTIKKLTDKVKNNRILDPQKREKDFLMEFKKLSHALLIAYRILYEELKSQGPIDHQKNRIPKKYKLKL